MAADRIEVHTTTRRSIQKQVFLQALAVDIREFGGQATLTETSSTEIAFSAVIDLPISPTLVTQEELVQSQSLRSTTTEVHHSSSGSICLPQPNSIDPYAINPKLTICKTRKDHSIFRLAKARQTYKAVTRPGRRIRALVVDCGQRKPVLMGGFELASSLYSLRCRDKLFNWHYANSIKVRHAGLRRIMDLTTCIAIPPYSSLLAGKLLAALSTSDAISQEFQTRYKDQLLAVFTSCASGLHCAVFNRIMIKAGGLFQRIGQTAGYSTVIFSKRTVAAARYLQGSRDNAKDAFASSSARTMRLMRNALRRCGIDPEMLLRLGNRKGIYMATLSPESTGALREGSAIGVRGFDHSAVISWWRSYCLAKRLGRTDVVRDIGPYLGPR